MNVAELNRDIHRHGGDETVDGDDLKLTATQPLPAELLNKLRDHKAELLEYLSSNAPATIAEPDTACPARGSGQWWQLPGQAWHCRQCEPDMLLAATTLTLPCHKEQAPHVGSLAGFECMLEMACEGLTITPGQLRQALKDDLESCGQLTALGLRLVAETLSAYLPPQNEAVAMLRQHPRVTHAFATDDDSDPDYVIVTLAIRNKATVDLRIPKDKYDGLAILEWIEQHTSGDLQ